MGKPVHIRFTIPLWIWRWRYSNWKKYIKAKLNPIKCDECGVKLAFRNPKYSVKGLTIQRCSGTLCRDCLVKDVHGVIADGAKMDDTHDVCDHCKKNALSFKGLYRAVQREGKRYEFGNRFYNCINSWNSSYICVPCTVETIQNGKECNDYTDHTSGRALPINEQGLPVINGKACFPNN
jgi:hypothetical protein